MGCALVFVGGCKCVGVAMVYDCVHWCAKVFLGVCGGVLGGVSVPEHAWICFVCRCVFLCSGMCM